MFLMRSEYDRGVNTVCILHKDFESVLDIS